MSTRSTAATAPGTIGNRVTQRRQLLFPRSDLWIVGGLAVAAAEFLQAALSAGTAGLAWPSLGERQRRNRNCCRRGHGRYHAAPGLEMGGFHRKPGNERRIKSIRQRRRAGAGAGHGRHSGRHLLAGCRVVGQEMAARVRKQVSARTGIPRATSIFAPRTPIRCRPSVICANGARWRSTT